MPLETVHENLNRPYRILGIGATAIDFLVQVDDECIPHLNEIRGNSIPCDLDTWNQLLTGLRKEPQPVPGGSAANTMRALAKLGESCGFFSYAGEDSWGEQFSKSLQEAGVVDKIVKSSLYFTTRVLCLISSDGQRTFIGYGPDAKNVIPSPLNLKDVEWVHIENWHLRESATVKTTLQLAKELKIPVSLNLFSVRSVQNCKEILLDLVPSYVDVLFGNEEEICALIGLKPQESCLMLQNLCPLVVVTLGSKGCLVGHQGRVIQVPTFTTQVVDTTGAGDFFAAGFIYGILNHYPVDTCALIGNRLGSAIIEVIGASLPQEKWDEVLQFISKIHHPRSQLRES